MPKVLGPTDNTGHVLKSSARVAENSRSKTPQTIARTAAVYWLRRHNVIVYSSSSKTVAAIVYCWPFQEICGNLEKQLK